ncbi:MAG: ABC transporter permease subunit [Lewinellaceae bacterium]|nr:ABC transporter permease subunit [Phaeodactylibacter sp.]MCB9042062.1 ABC transporter permease subunit [Lewinellaceae bacterium]
MQRTSTSTYLGLGLFFTLTAFPLLLGIGYALFYSLGLAGILSDGFTLEHWRAVLGSAGFWEAMAFSAYVALVSIGLAVALALGLVVRRPLAFERGPLSFYIYLPLAMPAIVMAFFIFQMMSKGGALSRIAYQLGLVEGLSQFPDWVNEQYGIGIITAHFLMALPFFIILYTQTYSHEGIKALMQQALTLGASRRQAAWRVAAPVLFRRSFATAILYFLFVMGSYEIPLLLGSQSRQMVSVLAIQKLQRYNLADIPQAYAISVVYSAIVIALVLWLLGSRRQL